MAEAQLQTLPVVHDDAPLPIAVRARAPQGAGPGLLWLGGYNSDMVGSKAVALDGWAGGRGLGCTRFDYSGHGESGGRFTDGTISRWLAEAHMVFDTATSGDQIVIGSSMGGWLALLLARQHLREAGHDARIRGLVLIAPAADMTGRLMWDVFPPAARRAIEADGVFMRPSDYGEPYPITRALIEDGTRHFILDEGLRVGCPVRILHGMRDVDVPWRLSLDVIAALAEDDVTLTLVKDGDHRLSRDEDIARLLALTESLL